MSQKGIKMSSSAPQACPRHSVKGQVGLPLPPSFLLLLLPPPPVQHAEVSSLCLNVAMSSLIQACFYPVSQTETGKRGKRFPCPDPDPVPEYVPSPSSFRLPETCEAHHVITGKAGREKRQKRRQSPSSTVAGGVCVCVVAPQKAFAFDKSAFMMRAKMVIVPLNHFLFVLL